MNNDKSKKCGEHSARITNLEKTEAEQWEVINRLRDRPPIWCTVVISILCLMLGAVLGRADLTGQIPEVINLATGAFAGGL